MRSEVQVLSRPPGVAWLVEYTSYATRSKAKRQTILHRRPHSWLPGSENTRGLNHYLRHADLEQECRSDSMTLQGRHEKTVGRTPPHGVHLLEVQRRQPVNEERLMTEKQWTERELLAELHNLLLETQKIQRRQARLLGSINSILVFFTVVVILGILASCVIAILGPGALF